jgi:hypothetical protein
MPCWFVVAGDGRLLMEAGWPQWYIFAMYNTIAFCSRVAYSPKPCGNIGFRAILGLHDGLFSGDFLQAVI